MKKLFTTLLAIVLSFSACFALTACNEKPEDDSDNTPKTMSYTAYDTQKGAIDELIASSADIAVVEKAFIEYYLNSHKDAQLTVLTGEDFTFESEQYVMALKKDSNVDDYINAALYKFQQEEITVNYTNNGGNISSTLSSVAESFGLKSNLITINQPSLTPDTAPDSSTDFYRILNDNFKIGFVVDGLTREINNQPFAGNSHYAGDDGFEVMLCRAIAKVYGKTVDSLNTQFIELENAKIALDTDTVDILIGGRSTKDWGDGFDFSVPYISNSQVIVVRSADKDKYSDYSKMKTAKFTAAKNSKGETLVKGTINQKVFGN